MKEAVKESFALFVIWQDGDSHSHYNFIAFATSVDSARNLAREYSSKNSLEVSYGTAGTLDPNNFHVGLRVVGWRENAHFVCEALISDQISKGEL